MPDRPGAIHEIMKALGEEGINVLAGYTNVLVYYERMSCDLVIDVRSASAGAQGNLVEVLKTRISGLGPTFKLVSSESVKL